MHFSAEETELKVLAPGTILQHLYLKERLARLRPGRFLEVGCGQGDISAILLQSGWKGTGIDLSDASIQKNRELNHPWIRNGSYKLFQTDFLHTNQFADEQFDLILSSMVIEHLDATSETLYLDRCRSLLARHGLVMLLVPASMNYWGVEDEIAGHFRRYDRESIKALAIKTGWTCNHLAGLTYPVSNLLLPISNWLVHKSEQKKLALEKAEQTMLSGSRNVRFKTNFPPILGLVLNKVTLLPLHWVQKYYQHSNRCMILYAELQP